MAAESAAYALAAVSQAPEPFRRMLSDIFGRRAGICTSGSWAVTAAGSPNMTVLVAPGTGLVLGSESSTQGLYFCQSITSTTVTIAAADATNPRRDLIVARIRDNQYATGPTSAFSLEVVAGTPAAGPADPIVPANCLVVARIQVNASPDATIVTGDITDLRTTYASQQRAAALGGVVVCTSTTRPTVNLTTGMFIWETDTKLGYVYNGSTWDYVYGAATAWTNVSFQNSWVNYGAPYQTVQYRKEGDLVRVRGVMKNGTNATTCFTLPSGFRPNSAEQFAVNGPNVYATIEIASTGTVLITTAGGNSAVAVEAAFSVTA